MQNTAIAYLMLRLAAGLSFLGHGLVRLPKLIEFSQWMTATFADSMLPRFLLLPFSYALPVAEFVLGILLVLGVFTKQALVAGSIVMLTLIFGSCLIEEWNAIPSQLIHILFLGILLVYHTHNHYSIDQFIKK